jgi:hypothetical protein
MSVKKRKTIHPLHEKGYYIIENGFTTSDGLMEELKRQLKSRKTSHIFNPDKKRLQKDLSIKPELIRNFIEQVLSQLKKENLSDNLYLRSPVILKSLPGCQRQYAHADHVPNKAWAEVLVYNMIDEIPLAIVCSVEDSKIDIWKGAINWLLPKTITEDIPRETIHLKAGSIFIFRGDLIHAGSEYDQENIRIHLYMDSQKLPHTHNMIHLVEGKREWEKHILDA